MTERTLASSLPCGEKEKEVLEDLELDIDALRHAVMHRLEWPGRRRGDEVLERAEGDRCRFGIFITIPKETRRRRSSVYRIAFFSCSYCTRTMGLLAALLARHY